MDYGMLPLRSRFLQGFAVSWLVGGFGILALVIAGWLYFFQQEVLAPSVSEENGIDVPSVEGGGSTDTIIAAPKDESAPTSPKVLAPAKPTPAPSPMVSVDTSGWKVYRNDSYGFEIKYPPISPWEVSEAEHYSKEAITVTFLNRSASRQVALVSSVQVKANTTASQEVAYWKSLGHKVTESSATVSGAGAKKLEIVNETLAAKPRSTIYIVGRGIRTYLISIHGVDPVKDADAVLFFNESLKSFKFF